jgi:hypothetical protein
VATTYIEQIIERALQQAFAKALEQSVLPKTEVLFREAFADGSPLAKRLEGKIEEGFQRFVDSSHCSNSTARPSGSRTRARDPD